MLRPEDTPEHKDNLINQLTDEKNKLKDKVDKLKEKADKFDENEDLFMFGCLSNDENSYEEDRVQRTRRRSNLDFANKEDCFGVKKFIGFSKYEGDRQYNTFSNYFEFAFHQNKKTGNNLMNDLQKCRSYGGNTWLCEFSGNNDLKIIELYLGESRGTQECRTNKRRYEATCGGAGGWRGNGQSYSGHSMIGTAPSSITNYWGLFATNAYGRVTHAGGIQNYKSYFRIYKRFFSEIKSILSGLSNNERPAFEHTHIGVRYAEPKNYNGFLTDICIKGIGCYGVDKDAGTILTENDGIQRIVDDGELRPGLHQNLRTQELSQYEGKKRWGRLYVTEYNRRYQVDTKNPYEFANMILYGKK